MKQLLLSEALAGAAVALALGGAPVHAAKPQKPQADATKPEHGPLDAGFVKEAGRSGMAEVQASKLALQKAQNPAVRDFAQRMVDDHTTAGDKLNSIAKEENVDVPGDLPKAEQKKIDSLQKVSGDTFDERYMDFFGVPAHEKAVNLFEREARAGSDAKLRSFASDTLPTLKEHLSMARDVQAKMSAKGEHKARGKTS